jgi:hypothetical protein
MTKGAVIIDNRDVGDAIERHVKFLPKDWAIIHLTPNIRCIQDYNDFMVSDFWCGMPDVVLVFQQDSELFCEGIEDFIKWDFIGAPIPAIGYPAMNGGLSIRRSSAMMKVINNCPYIGGNEDMFFCNNLHAMGMNIAPYHIAELFSSETEFRLGTIGCHAINSHLSDSQCKEIRKQYD